MLRPYIIYNLFGTAKRAILSAQQLNKMQVFSIGENGRKLDPFCISSIAEWVFLHRIAIESIVCHTSLRLVCFNFILFKHQQLYDTHGKRYRFHFCLNIAILAPIDCLLFIYSIATNYTYIRKTCVALQFFVSSNEDRNPCPLFARIHCLSPISYFSLFIVVNSVSKQ